MVVGALHMRDGNESELMLTRCVEPLPLSFATITVDEVGSATAHVEILVPAAELAVVHAAEANTRTVQSESVDSEPNQTAASPLADTTAPVVGLFARPKNVGVPRVPFSKSNEAA